MSHNIKTTFPMLCRSTSCYSNSTDPLGHGRRIYGGVLWRLMLDPLGPLGRIVGPPWFETHAMDAQSNWDLGNVEVGELFRFFSCIPRLVPEQFVQCSGAYCPATKC